ncbi:MAG: undecaprenyl/decaprenyl-phosphate alpha-N-acetylglucosaminyl 1-phosphate transferase [Candidatus Doudnabacteria bacterium]|nr:undecaprenyl/decaprenyl-phosphate alpha-N-acetylglucosaminyl 1-phosphate transferase [Candidatus Doudnabacteria bacterium]
MRFAYFAGFSLAFFISFVLTFIVSRIAFRKQIIDIPDNERKFHKYPTPTLGGLAVFGSFLFVSVTMVFTGHMLGNIPMRELIGIWVGGIILMVGGYLDDKYRLSPGYTIIFPILACLTVVTSGISAVSLNIPWTGDKLLLDEIIIYGVPLISGIVVFLWTLGMTYTTKILDGMDGLVTGIAAIAGMVLFGLSLTPAVQQPQTALLAMIFVGSLLGFLILNFYPAKIFLGEGGSTFAGYMLAILAIVSGGKVATAILVMGIPVLDLFWVILQRIFNRQSPFQGDRRHLHYKLTEIGFSEPQAVLFMYALTGIFGVSALFLQSMGKLIALGILVGVMIVIIVTIFIIYKSKQNKSGTVHRGRT